MTERMKILLYSDGTTHANEGLEMGTQIALVLANTVDILAVSRHVKREALITPIVNAAADEIRAADIPVAILWKDGPVTQEVIDRSEAIGYGLVVIGSRGRRGLKRLLAGSRACEIVEHGPASILVVKGYRQRPIARILVCSAAGPTSEPTVCFAARLAQATSASVTLIHVMSQVALEWDAQARDLEAEAKELIEAHSREGDHMDRMLALLKEENVKAHAVVRHGLVVEEVLTEAREGRFDILVIGAHITPGIKSTWVDDLSEQIMLSADRPVLVVRQC